MSLDLSSFDKALTSLGKALSRSKKSPTDEELRDACIQRFEYTFEIAWKMLKRRIEIDIGVSAEVDSYSKKALFRVGGERGLIQNVAGWFDYLEKRNLTTHTYDSDSAQEVFGIVENFTKDAADLLNRLKSCND